MSYISFRAYPSILRMPTFAQLHLKSNNSCNNRSGFYS